MARQAKWTNGDRLEDKVSGFKGVVMVVAYYATGCIHYGLCPKINKDGDISDWQWLDESRLKLDESKVVVFDIAEGTSGAMPNGPQM